MTAPRYVAIVTDGPAGPDGSLVALLAEAASLGVEELTLCGPFGEALIGEAAQLGHEGVRIRCFGQREGRSAELTEQLERAEAETAANRRITLFLAVEYGGRAEIVDAARSFQGDSEEEFRAHLYAPDMHDPDLLIRTDGAERISDRLLWQCAYSELVFRSDPWPRFGPAELAGALAEYETRQRRFGARA